MKVHLDMTSNHVPSDLRGRILYTTAGVNEIASK